VAVDSSTWKRNGAVSGAATWRAGIEGTAVNFDGLDDRVSLPAVAMDGLADLWLDVASQFEGTIRRPTIISAANAGQTITVLDPDGCVGPRLLDVPFARPLMLFPSGTAREDGAPLREPIVIRKRLDHPDRPASTRPGKVPRR